MLKKEVKEFETKLAVEQGADEVDMVLNISWAKEHKFDQIAEEVALLKKAAGKALLKVILETCLLTDFEIVECCKASLKGKADFVKTSTGFSKGGATVEAVSLMRATVGGKAGVKASGGVHNAEEAHAMVKAGANRIGASASVVIMKEIEK